MCINQLMHKLVANIDTVYNGEEIWLWVVTMLS